MIGRRPPADRAGRDRGSMAVEVIFLVPILLAFTLLAVAAGRYADMHGRVDAVTRDAVRAASLERDRGSAEAAAQAVADQSLIVGKGVTCTRADLGGQFEAGQTITVTLTCSFSLSKLGLIGFPGETRITGVSSAPIDIFRRA